MNQTEFLKIKKMAIGYFVFQSLMFSAVFAEAQDTLWRIKKTTWTEADENAYSEFVAIIGKAVEKKECRSFKTCIQHPSNPYKGTDAGQLDIHVDCARLSYAMRAYFAWKNGLPFSHVSKITYRNAEDKAENPRSNSYGNIVVSRANVLPQKSGSSYSLINATSYISKNLMGAVYTAVLRMEDEVLNKPGLESDYYPTDISRDAIKAGTTIYDASGHAAIVYKITDDGKIYFIDAHPDNSLTSNMYGEKLGRSRPAHGAGFKNFRSIELKGATFDANLGSYVGGQIAVASVDKHKYYSLVQKYGTDNKPRPDWSKGPFILGGVKYDYRDYLRLKMSKGALKINPIEDVKSLTADLCSSALDRADSVQLAINAGVHLQAHPPKLPANIYGTSGLWEEYSTPSRDARFKTSFKELRTETEKMFNLYKKGDPTIVYTGTDLKKDMLNAYLQVANSCLVKYSRSDKSVMTLNLEQIRQRLFGLSFDPYHCPELRWGASSAQELATCKDDANKREWYKREIWLRYQIQREYGARMDYSLAELDGPKPGGVGVAAPPDVDVIKYLSTP